MNKHPKKSIAKAKEEEINKSQTLTPLFGVIIDRSAAGHGNQLVQNEAFAQEVVPAVKEAVA